MTLAQPRWFVREICSLTAGGLVHLGRHGSSFWWSPWSPWKFWCIIWKVWTAINPGLGCFFLWRTVRYVTGSCWSHEPAAKVRVMRSVSSMFFVIYNAMVVTHCVSSQLSVTGNHQSSDQAIITYSQYIKLCAHTHTYIYVYVCVYVYRLNTVTFS